MILFRIKFASIQTNIYIILVNLKNYSGLIKHLNFFVVEIVDFLKLFYSILFKIFCIHACI
jgi:hypothetical protein